MKYESMNFKAPENILSQTVNDEMVLFNLETEVYFSLDEIGARFFGLLTSDLPYEDVLTRLEEEYEVERSVLQGDLEKFVESLLETNLLEKS
jgi:hypothetical protein